MTDLLIADGNYNIIGVVDIYEYLMWERRFYQAGYFELHVPATDNNLTLLKQGNFIFKGNASENGIIKYINVTDEGDGRVTITASGYFLSYLLHGHIVKNRVSFTDTAENIMRSLVESTVMNEYSEDYISYIKLGEKKGITKVITFTTEYTDLHTALSEISKQSGVSFILRADLNEKLLYFECYEGLDRSAEQTVNPQVIFSPRYDTILSSPTYTDDDTVTVNAAVAFYSGSLGRVVVEYNPEKKTGTEKKAVAVRGQAVTYTTEGGGQALDVAATQAALLALAKEQIKSRTNRFTSSVSFTGNLEYKKSYDIGDIVTTEYPDWQVSLTQRIHKVTEIYDSTGTEVIPELGDVWPKGKDDE